MLARVRPIVGAFAMVVLSVAACGGGTATQAPTAARTASPTSAGGGQAASAAAGGGGGPAVDAGSVLTPEAAGSIIGGTVTKQAIPPTGAMSIVAYTNTAGDSVTVLVEQVPGGATSELMQAGIGAAGARGEVQPLSDLGDAAGKVVNANDASVVFVKGNTLVVIHAEAATSSGTDLEPKLESLARQIEGKF